MNLDRLNLNRRTRVTAGTTSTLDPADRAAEPVATDAAPVDASPAAGTTPVPVDTSPVRVDTEPVRMDRRSVLARQKEAFGGAKVGAAFFGWLTATGTAVLLTALVAAGGTAVGVLNGASVSHPDFGVTWRGTRGAIVIVAILLVAYFAGGYVAGRMARFNGLTQGVAVFAWAIVVALVVAAMGAVAGTQWSALRAVTGVPAFSPSSTHITENTLLVGLFAVAAALLGAVLGGLSGMRFHRRVDRAGLGR
jgi:hypothetical protein